MSPTRARASAQPTSVKKAAWRRLKLAAWWSPRVDYNENSADIAQQQTAAVLQANPDIVGMFATNTFGALGAGTAIQNAGLQGAVEVALFDASEENIGFLKDGIVSLVIAQKPADMGYLGVALATGRSRWRRQHPGAHPDRLRRHHRRQCR